MGGVIPLVTNKKRVNGCIGKCCSEFSLIGDTKEDYVKDGIDGDEESAFIGEMLIYIGQDGENPEWPTYTCKYWDTKSSLCTVYDKRPQMCRDYPNGEPCEWEGCGYDPSKEDE